MDIHQIGYEGGFNLANKYKDKDIYKQMWNELKSKFEEPFKKATTEEEFIVLGMSGMSAMLEEINDIERKYNKEEK
jgi:cobyric acid synthase